MRNTHRIDICLHVEQYSNAAAGSRRRIKDDQHQESLDRYVLRRLMVYLLLACEALGMYPHYPTACDALIIANHRSTTTNHFQPSSSPQSVGK